jgi:hypothetical protein
MNYDQLCLRRFRAPPYLLALYASLLALTLPSSLDRRKPKENSIVSDDYSEVLDGSQFEICINVLPYVGCLQ